MQFDKPDPGADMVPLPRPSIDTGMGLERISAILQGKHDNYDVDLLRKLIEASASASNDDPDGDNNVSHRVIADHLRSAAFLVADGVRLQRSRGYVPRRIMRRGRHAHKIGNKDPLMHRLVPTLVRPWASTSPSCAAPRRRSPRSCALRVPPRNPRPWPAPGRRNRPPGRGRGAARCRCFHLDTLVFCST